MSVLLALLAATLLEPSAGTDGLPLVDLESCTVVVSDAFGTGSQVFTASSSAGGGSQTFDPVSIYPVGRGSGQSVGICTNSVGDSGQSNVLAHGFPALSLPSAPTLTEP